jgi:uncharacterized membrane protein (UPF0182 family)
LARNPSDLRRSRRRVLLFLVLGVVGVALVFGALSGFYIDILWFREVGLSSVFWTRLWSRVALGAVFGVAFFAIVYANLLIVRRLRPRYRVFSPEEEVIERYRTMVEPYVRLLLPAVSLVLAIIAGVSISGEWQSYQLWREAGSVSMGVADPLFGRDVAFYLLSLPFLELVQSWLFTSLVAITVVSAAAYYLWGGIRLRSPGDRVTPQVKAHLSVLLGLIVLTKAWGYRLGQFNLLTSQRGTGTGASYTDVNAHLPALRFLVIVAIICAVLFLVNIRFRGWALPILGLGLLAVTSVVGGALVPSFVQRFSVAPQELQRERKYIERNIELTRRAYGIDVVQEQPFSATPGVTAEEIEASTETLENIRLWNPGVLEASYNQLQRIRPYYDFEDVDVDRYVVDGQRRTVMIAPREIRQNGIPEAGRTWQNQHLVYTHGYGAIASRVDQSTTAGSPVFVLSEIPPSGPLADSLGESRVYFQEQSDVDYVMVGTGSREFDYPQESTGEQVRTEYDGEAGILVGGFLRRLAFAWKFQDVNLLISGLIDERSRVLMNLDVQDRIEKVAPFLSYDDDPYAALVDGRLVWIQDAYTTSARFPYSELHFLRAEAGTSEEGLSNESIPEVGNYIRNSAKVVVDAYDGTMTFYRTETDDPIIAAWSRVFPGLFTDVADASEDLQNHFRYPEDLFRIQTHLYANYHVTDPAQFYAKEDFWTVPEVRPDPTATVTDDGTSPDSDSGQAADAVELEPYYLQLPLPGEEESAFRLFTSFTPLNRPNMVAWMAAESDPGSYGEITSFEFAQQNVTGPPQAAALISQDTEISQQVSLLDQLGSQVNFGDLLAIPIGQSFLYVQPLYTEAAGGGAIPELKRVIVVSGERVEMANTLAEALEEEFQADAPTEEPPPEEPGGPGPEEPAADVVSLLAEAQQHFEAAEAALAEGDLGTYQAEIDRAQALVQEAAQLAGVAPSPSPGG